MVFLMDRYGIVSCAAAFLEGRKPSTPPWTYGRGAETSPSLSLFTYTEAFLFTVHSTTKRKKKEAISPFRQHSHWITIAMVTTNPNMLLRGQESGYNHINCVILAWSNCHCFDAFIIDAVQCFYLFVVRCAWSQVEAQLRLEYCRTGGKTSLRDRTVKLRQRHQNNVSLIKQDQHDWYDYTLVLSRAATCWDCGYHCNCDLV